MGPPEVTSGLTPFLNMIIPIQSSHTNPLSSRLQNYKVNHGKEVSWDMKTSLVMASLQSGQGQGQPRCSQKQSHQVGLM